MHPKNMEFWNNFVRQAQRHIEGDSPCHEDSMILSADVYMKSLEKRICDMQYKEDIRISRMMSVGATEKLAKEQIDNETMMKGNV